jgi:hypothetical protein
MPILLALSQVDHFVIAIHVVILGLAQQALRLGIQGVWVRGNRPEPAQPLIGGENCNISN